jgi:uncharacterized protein (DUF2235 family)
MPANKWLAIDNIHVLWSYFGLLLVEVVAMPKPKNIVLCADGTGNSSGALFTTNVWRLYLALDADHPERQVAYFHDGVGTSSIRPLALLTGAVGYGLKRNVLDIYRFLCRNYKPGDRIFGFGFSRGSFTIRILMGLVATQGLVPYSGDEAQLARDATAAYREFRRGFHTATHVEWLFRIARDLVLTLWDLPWGRKKYDPQAQVYPDAIQFVGVWDTVDAYGGPIDEISDGVDYWLFPLSLRDLWLPAKVRRACHALALDEERQAFWPRLWRDGYVKDKDGNYHDIRDNWRPITEQERRDISELPRTFPLQPIDQERLTQVWFAGVHCDVGGAYSKAGLSYVTLEWMMDRAATYGLQLNPHQVAHLQACANKFDEINDSRRGVGTYYRYKPRKHAMLYETALTAPICVQAWNELLRILYITRFVNKVREIFIKYRPPPQEPDRRPDPPIIHRSVFDRITAGANAYAPIVLRDNYHIGERDYRVAEHDGRVTNGPVGTAVANAGRAVPGTERVWNLVWFRRVMYFATLLATLALVAGPPLVDYFYPGHTAVGWASCLNAILDLAQATVLPKFAMYWTGPAKHMPQYVVILAVVIAVLIWESGRLKQGIGNAMGQVWGKRFDGTRANEELWSAPWPANTSWVWWLRTRPLYQDLFESLRFCILPTLIIWVPGLYLLLRLFRWILPKLYEKLYSNYALSDPKLIAAFVIILLAANFVIVLLNNLLRRRGQ